MKEYLNSLQNISTLIKKVTSNTESSIEINNSAETLNSLIQPCYQEYKASLIKLKSFHETCLQHIENAEDVWQSKFRIEDLAKVEVIQQLGEFSSCDCRILQLKQINQTEFLTILNQYWEDNLQNLEKKYFFDSNKNTLKTSINMFERDSLIKDLIKSVEIIFSDTIDNLIKNSLIPIKDECLTLNLDKMETNISLLDLSEKERIRVRKNYFLAKLYDYFSEEINKMTTKYKNELTGNINELNKKSLMGVNFENFQKLKSNIKESTDIFTDKVFNKLNNLIVDIIEEGIKFYNYLLEKQKRYEEETEDKRNSEKQWLDSQKHQLEMIQGNVDNILDILN